MDSGLKLNEILTIFIPSYNRSEKLKRALSSIKEEKERSEYGKYVKVLVVDDFSSEPIEFIIDEFRKVMDIEFHLHKKKCGVAELAMFSCLGFIHTKFAWLIGNDDIVMPGGIDRVFRKLIEGKRSFLLLNMLGVEKDGSTYEYFLSDRDEYYFSTARELFLNFGFATATTTFPCLCFEVAPILQLEIDSITGISPIYSHTFAFYRAFFDKPASFIPKPVVLFNHNEESEEQQKLASKNASRKKTSYFHASIGMVRHIQNICMATGVTAAEVANYREDEVNKKTKRVVPTTTGLFIFNFSVAQLAHEVMQMVYRNGGTIFTTLEEIHEIREYFITSNLADLAALYNQAVGVYWNPGIQADQKARIMASIQEEGLLMAKKLYGRQDEFEVDSNDVLHLPHGGLKVLKRLTAK